MVISWLETVSRKSLVSQRDYPHKGDDICNSQFFTVRPPNVVDGPIFYWCYFFIFHQLILRAHQTKLKQTLLDVLKWAKFEITRPKFWDVSCP